ncbi:uncharacterized protein LOC103356180 [Stegastes partitus]|uniref:Uncharacterized protein LOC103356180 n=1 Tax=Stegastes partitus TaxID=144197 RepID=A0A9Y4MWS4_9TELE|nr:PREDICTED: uncharacterized protein LOC103356180 [Stegastes partitus]
MLLLLLLLLSNTVGLWAQRVSGLRKDGSCMCKVNSTMWVFPAVKFESVLEEVDACEGSLDVMQKQVALSRQQLPQMEAQVLNASARLQPHQYLQHQGLYTALTLRQLGQELQQLETHIGVVHNQLNNTQTRQLSREVDKLRTDVNKLQTSDTVNMKTVREKLRYLNNNVESCKSIPKDYRGTCVCLCVTLCVTVWALYATVGNHGNLVASRLVWDDETKSLNVTQTWQTRLFKKAVSNAFMVCGVLYATRYLDEHREEVFYAFDTATGKEDNSLALPLEKIAKGVASVSYNPIDKQIYMYNDGYLLAYQAHF